MQDESESAAGKLDTDIEEEHNNWKQNVPFLYDIAITHVLTWPTITVQWLPNFEIDANDNELHRLIIGTNTSGKEQNYLKVLQVVLPKSLDETMDPTLVNNIRKTQNVGKVDEIQCIPHEGEVNRARYMPQNPNLIATWTPSGQVLQSNIVQVHIFDISDQEIKDATLRLKYHKKEGYGLSWSPLSQGQLLTAGYDRNIALWDIEKHSAEPVQTYRIHTKEVEDVCWHVTDPNIFASCSDDCTFSIMDIRQEAASYNHKAHDAEINSIQFNPGHEHLFLTASSDNIIKLFDFRKPDQDLHDFQHHDDAVFALQWGCHAKHEKRYFATGSQDRKVIIWDLAKVGCEIKAEDEHDGPGELLFIHAGHQSKVQDISWNPNVPFLCASVEESKNVLQIWKMQRTVLEEEDEDDQLMEEELEVQLQ